MKRLTQNPVLLILPMALLVGATAVHAGFKAKKIDEALYEVSFTRSPLVAGGKLTDSPGRNMKTLRKKTRELCRKSGYRFYRATGAADVEKIPGLKPYIQGGTFYVDGKRHSWSTYGYYEAEDVSNRTTMVVRFSPDREDEVLSRACYEKDRRDEFDK